MHWTIYKIHRQALPYRKHIAHFITLIEHLKSNTVNSINNKIFRFILKTIKVSDRINLSEVRYNWRFYKLAFIYI